MTEEDSAVADKKEYLRIEAKYINRQPAFREKAIEIITGWIKELGVPLTAVRVVHNMIKPATVRAHFFAGKKLSIDEAEMMAFMSIDVIPVLSGWDGDPSYYKLDSIMDRYARIYANGEDFLTDTHGLITKTRPIGPDLPWDLEADPV